SAAAFASLSRTKAPLEALSAVVDTWGGSFWELIPFTMQMSLILITGSMVAQAPPVFRAIARLAQVPKSPKAAVAFVAIASMASSWINWGFSLVFSAMLAREVARRTRVDYRAVAASAFLGLGSIWAQGLSGSAALLMATPTAIPAALKAVIARDGLVPSGVLPFSATIFLWQSFVSVAIEVVIVTAVMWWAAPAGDRLRTASDLGVDLGPSEASRPAPESRGTPGEWLEHRPYLNVLFVALAGAYLVRTAVANEQGLSGLSVNIVNLVFLTAAVALHGTPARLMRAAKEATPGIWAVVLQYPFYAAIAALMTKSHLNEVIASWFVGISTPTTFPAIVAVYSGVLGMFVPSGGSKWVIEAPYVLQAAHDLHVHLGWMVAVYDLGEALANLVQPFWMVPTLTVLGLKARDVMGYTSLVFVVLVPVVLVLVTVLGATLPYPL
ncbi:MAG: short-chain fatty acid transporter, partial [Archangium sp.]|nr:short-chain fatty acid transporter [Archangium sp.]